MTALERITAGRPADKKRVTSNPVESLAAHAVEAVLDKKGHDITVMDMRSVSGVADLFVVCTGDSDLQVKAIADSVQDRIRNRCSERPWHVEGYEHQQWVLIDYVDLVVHIFSPEKRLFYALERLWGDAPVERVPDEGSYTDVSFLRDARISGAGESEA
jgi:ribosome-associated protein